MEMEIIQAAVIGVGVMGRNHARILAQMEDVNLAAVADVSLEIAEPVARTYKAHAYADYREMLDRERLDIVTVAVPTRAHRQVTGDVIAHGLHVFVEKPLAASVREGQELIDAARDQGVTLAVGHVERFNPVVIELKRRLEAGQAGRVFQMIARRVGPFPSRVEDVGVVFDLATHELDIMEYLSGSPIASLYAETEREIHAQHEDLLSCLLRFRNGTIGLLDVNWLTPTKIRQLTVLGERGMFLVNYLTQELFFYENGSANGWEGLVALMGVSEGTVTRYEIRRREPLKEELEAFVRAVRRGEPPLVGGEEGLRAVYLAEKLVESGREHRLIRLDS
ncbi:MAG TPA: Gfo/Idh/MocA family oxidoreductase [Caldilineae bacterium]|nr:Gfo/Idh/MocA family oxidoreductase [Caldilineae bacterium]